jgi:sugar transferase (PEP-CTERM/EpsH1 system associated)
VVHTLDVGGLENGLVNIVNDHASGIRHSIICLARVGKMRSRLASDIDVFELEKRPGHDVRAFARLVGLLRHLRADVVHSRNWGTVDAVFAARLAGVPAVVHGEHGYDNDDPEGRNRWKRSVRRVCGAFIDRFVVVSDDLHCWLTSRVGIPERKIVKIANGVDIHRFAPGDGTAVRRELQVPADALVVGTVGRLEAVKNQASLVQAFATLAATRPQVFLVIAGEGRCRSALEDLARQSNVATRIRFLGERTDVPRLLQAMDVFVLPSVAEGMSNTLLEAMASGLPIVATRVGGSLEVVADRINGVLVESRPEALAAAIGQYVSDQAVRRQHGIASRRRVADLFPLERMRSAYGGLYRQLGAAAID